MYLLVGSVLALGLGLTQLFLSGILSFDSIVGLDYRGRPTELWCVGRVEAPQVRLIQSLRHGNVHPFVLSKRIVEQSCEFWTVYFQLLAGSQVADDLSCGPEHGERVRASA